MNQFTNPAFVFAYNMYGYYPAMGTLNLDLSVDSGATWINEWTKTGNQGQNWHEVAISLSAYAGQIVRVRIQYISGNGPNPHGDCAIDYLRFMENPGGCMDPTACNYNPAATVNDESCLTVYGCMDSTATNYNILATCDDGTCCFTYYGCTDSTACNYDPNAVCDNDSCNYPISSSTTETACDSYTWPLNGQTYTSSGVYTYSNFSISPSLLSTYNTPYANDVTVSGRYAYVAAGGSGLQIIDISNPSSPTLIGTYNTPNFAYDVTVSGNYAFVADGTSGLQIIDISNPSSPTLTGSYNTAGSGLSSPNPPSTALALGVSVSGNYCICC